MLQLTDLLLFSATFIVACFLMRRWVERKKTFPLPLPPSMPSLPLVGSLPFFRRFDDLPGFFMEKAKELGPMFTFKIGSRLCLTLNSKDTIVEAFQKNSARFSGREIFYLEKVINKNGKGIAARNASPEYRRYRQLVLSILKEFGFGDKPLMEDRIQTEVDLMSSFIREKNGATFDPSDMVMLGSFNVITNIMLGTREDYKNRIPSVIQYINDGVKNISMTLDVAPTILKHVPCFKRKLDAYTDYSWKVIAIIETEVEKIKLDPEMDCFVSRYLEREGPGYDQEQLVYTIRDIIAAGTTTTASTLLWLLIFVANHPLTRERLQREIDEVVPKYRRPSLDDQSKLRYVEATILEMMRMRTVVPLALPHLTMKDSIVQGFFVPAGTVVMANLHAVHMNAEIWKDPHVFRPERFLDTDNTIVNREEIISFSTGGRSCLGESLALQELFLFFTGWLQDFNILPPEHQKLIDNKPSGDMVIEPLPFKIRMIPRETLSLKEKLAND